MATFPRPPFPQSLRCRITLLLLATALVAVTAGTVSAGAYVTASAEFGLQRRAAPSYNETKPLQYHKGPVLHSTDSYAIYWDPTGSYRGDWMRLIDEYFQGVGSASGTLGNVFALNGQYRDSSGPAANQSTFRGPFTAEDPYPETENCTHKPAGAPVCLTDQQIRAELVHVIETGGLPGATGTPVYYVLTPPGVTVCTDIVSANCSDSTASPANGICGYHSAINPGGTNPIVYAVQPWVAGDSGQFITSEEPLITSKPTEADLACQDAKQLNEPNQLAGKNPFGNWAEGLADVIVNDLSIEQSNMVTDPLLNGWYQNGTRAEQSDMCQWNFGPPPVKPPTIPEEQRPANAQIIGNESINNHPYYVQWAFDSVGVTAGKGHTCWSGVALEAHYTAPNPVNAGDVVGFDASESNITLNAHTKGLPEEEPFVAPIYTWNFGDGNTVSGANASSEFHSYKYGGTYNAMLTVTDSSGNSNSYTKQITVVGPPAPGTGSTAAGGAAAAAPGAGSTPGSAASATSKPKPVAAAAAVSHSLRSVLRHGLLVRYSVSEQVAGHVEVLLASSIAHRLGLHGPTATGLARGTAPQIVIGKAILVTTKGGRSTLDIVFSKRTASRLAHLHGVSLMLRLVVRNAANQSVTVLGSVTLSH